MQGKACSIFNLRANQTAATVALGEGVLRQFEAVPMRPFFASNKGFRSHEPQLFICTLEPRDRNFASID